jgi:hypothetical protein
MPGCMGWAALPMVYELSKSSQIYEWVEWRLFSSV